MADELEFGMHVVVNHQAKRVIEATNAIVRLLDVNDSGQVPAALTGVHFTGGTYAYGVLPDGHIIDERGNIVHVYENVAPPGQLIWPVEPPFLSSNSLLIGRMLKADELQPNTIVVVCTSVMTYRTMWVAQINERTVDFWPSQNDPKPIPFTVHSDKTLKNSMGWPIKVFEYLG